MNKEHTLQLKDKIQWVDVNIQLPDNNKSVLLCLNSSRFVIIGWFNGDDFVTEDFSNYEHGTSKVYPSHWMDKPKPPEWFYKIKN